MNNWTIFLREHFIQKPLNRKGLFILRELFKTFCVLCVKTE